MSSLFKRNTKDSISEMLEGGNTVRVQVTFDEVILMKKNTPEKVKSLEIRIPAHDEPSESVSPKKAKKSGIVFHLTEHNITFDVLFDKTNPVEFELEIMHKNKGPLSIAKFDLRMTDLLSKKEIRREVHPTYEKLQKIKIKYRVSRSNSMREKTRVPTGHEISARNLQSRSDRSEPSGNGTKETSTIEMQDLNPQKAITETQNSSALGERVKPKVKDLNSQQPTVEITDSNPPKPSTDAPNPSDLDEKSKNGGKRGWEKVRKNVEEKRNPNPQRTKAFGVEIKDLKPQKPCFRPESCILVMTTFLHFLSIISTTYPSFPRFFVFMNLWLGFGHHFSFLRWWDPLAGGKQEQSTYSLEAR